MKIRLDQDAQIDPELLKMEIEEAFPDATETAVYKSGDRWIVKLATPNKESEVKRIIDNHTGEEEGEILLAKPIEEEERKQMDRDLPKSTLDKAILLDQIADISADAAVKKVAVQIGNFEKILLQQKTNLENEARKNREILEEKTKELYAKIEDQGRMIKEQGEKIKENDKVITALRTLFANK